MNPRPDLRVVDSDTGEVAADSELTQAQVEIDKLKTDLKMAKRDVTTKNRRIAELERDKARERMDYYRYEDVQRIATYWHRKCRPRDYARGERRRINPMAPNRFDAVRGILDQQRIVIDETTGKRHSEPMYSLEECKAAVDGACFDHFAKRRRNGGFQHFNDLELIFRDSTHFEDFRDRAPRAR